MTTRRRRKPVLFWTAFGVFLVALATVGFWWRTSSNGATGSAQRRGEHAESSDSTAVVARGELKRVLLLDGDLRAVSSRAIFASTSEEAKIVYLPPEGSTVKAGDRLVELDSGTILGKIKDAEEKIVAADNEIVKTRSTDESALRDLEVELSKLWLAFEQAKVNARAPAQVLSRREYQDYQLALEKARTEYDTQVAKIQQKKKEQEAELQVKTIQLEKLRAQLEQQKANLEGMTIRAPADGMVIYSDHWFERRKIQVGDVVWGGFPILRLPDLRAMEAIAQVNEVDGPKLSVGQRATVTLDSYPDVEITGTVKDIAETAIKASWMAKAKVFRAVIALDRTVPEIMKPGMSAQISVELPSTPVSQSSDASASSARQSGLVVPRSSVQCDNNGCWVIRTENETRRQVAVTIVASDAVSYGIADNGALKSGDRILVRNN